MYESIYIFVPAMKQIIRISEGTGDNLTDEDIDAGYVDYIYYDQHNLEPNLPETDGGMIMLTELFQDKFKSTKEAIPNVLEMAYGCDTLPYIILE